MHVIQREQRLVYDSALTLMILSAVLLVLRWAFGWGDDRVMYRLASSDTPTLLNGLLFALFFVFCFLLLTLIFARLLHAPFSNQLADRTTISLFLAFICVCGYFVVDSLDTSALQRTDLQSASLNGQVFHLQFTASTSGLDFQIYELYQCDRFDVLCNRVYTQANGISLKVETIELDSDSASNVLSVVINGEVAFSTE